MKILVNRKPPHRAHRVSLVINTSGRNMDSIVRLVHSISRQTYRDFEFLAATESNGGTILEKASAILGNAIPVRIVETGFWNRCRTGNVGIVLSKGEYVALLEDDLVLDSQWLETLVHCLERSPPETACCCGKCTTVGGSESLSLEYEQLSSAIRIVGLLMMHNSLLRKLKEPITFNLCVLCRKKALVDAGLFDTRVEEPILGEDYDLAMRIVSQGSRIVYDPAATSLHYTRPVTKRANDIKRNPRELEKLVQNEIYLFTKNRNILGLYLPPHVIYRAFFEGINMGLRTRTYRPLFYAFEGAIRGFIDGLLHGK